MYGTVAWGIPPHMFFGFVSTLRKFMLLPLLNLSVLTVGKQKTISSLFLHLLLVLLLHWSLFTMMYGDHPPLYPIKAINTLFILTKGYSSW